MDGDGFDDETAEPLEVIDLGPAEETRVPRSVRPRLPPRAVGGLVAVAVLGLAALVTVGALNHDETRAGPTTCAPGAGPADCGSLLPRARRHRHDDDRHAVGGTR